MFNGSDDDKMKRYHFIILYISSFCVLSSVIAMESECVHSLLSHIISPVCSFKCHHYGI